MSSVQLSSIVRVIILIGMTGSVSLLDVKNGYSECDLSCSAEAPCDASCMSFYGAIRTAFSSNRVASGGFNLVGAFPNTGSDVDESFDIGGALGISFLRDWGRVRMECEAMSRGMFNTVTNSFAPPTPTFFYNVNYKDHWTVMGNLWFDMPINDRISWYFGGGVGSWGGRIDVTDNVALGRETLNEFAWQAGLGILWHYGNRLDIDLGYRYLDSGTTRVPLTSTVSGLSAGNYEADLTSHQVVLGFQYNNLFNLFR